MPNLAELDSPVRSLLEEVLSSSTPQPNLVRIRPGACRLRARHGLPRAPHGETRTRPASFGQRELARTADDEPVLLLVHRPEGVMSKCTPTAFGWRSPPLPAPKPTASSKSAAEPRRCCRPPSARRAPPRASSSDFVTMAPPEDVHDHGHVSGIGQPAFILVLYGKAASSVRAPAVRPLDEYLAKLAPGVMQV
jgi:hypothetical protein